MCFFLLVNSSDGAVVLHHIGYMLACNLFFLFLFRNALSHSLFQPHRCHPSKWEVYVYVRFNGYTREIKVFPHFTIYTSIISVHPTSSHSLSTCLFLTNTSCSLVINFPECFVSFCFFLVRQEIYTHLHAHCSWYRSNSQTHIYKIGVHHWRKIKR